eukprot:Seg1734.12 transcript_id=Seg1734.12/GoldUCD/mRNA.D3Y31 product=Syndecan protein_id=Seg1734.12/GoldUCD/D3Y31
MGKMKALICFALLFGLVVSQNGDVNPATEGSGQGSGDESMEGSTPPTKKAFTSKPDDTTDEPGSGDDDEDLKLVVTRKPMAKTNRPTTMIHHTDNVDEEGSGSGGSGAVDVIQPSTPLSKDPQPDPTTTPKKASKKIIPVTMPVTFNKREETEEPITKAMPVSVRKEMTKPRPVAKLTPTPNNVIEPEEAKTTENAEITTANDVEWINYSTTTEPKTSTTGHPNKIKEPVDPINPGNTAQQRGNNGQSKPALSFTTGIIIGVVAGAILALLVILFLVYRLRKRDEGSYSLEEPITGYTKQEPGSPTSEKEYFA